MTCRVRCCSFTMCILGHPVNISDVDFTKMPTSSSDTTTPGLNDGEKIPTRTKNTQKSNKIHNFNLYHVISTLRVVSNVQR